MLDKPLHPFSDLQLQAGNRGWWQTHPMRYNWRSAIIAPAGTAEFFDEVDRRFFSASPFFSGRPPFERLIPFETLRAKRVLEIGCGLGSHSQLLSEAGCELTAIDITARAVELTQRRLAIKGLPADVLEMDAECLEFPDSSFDFVWSWGVIHHSAHTEQIIREVARVLKPDGEFRFMVYNRKAFDTFTKIARGVVTGKALRLMSVDEILSYYTDGFVARFYTRQQLADSIRQNGLGVQAIEVLGQTSELVPLPGRGLFGRLKYDLVARIPDALARPALSTMGSFLFAVARKTPEAPDACRK